MMRDQVCLLLGFGWISSFLKFCLVLKLKFYLDVPKKTIEVLSVTQASVLAVIRDVCAKVHMGKEFQFCIEVQWKAAV